jgi:hypothetical protein
MAIELCSRPEEGRMQQRFHEAAQRFYAVMPRALSADLLAEYGLEVSAEQSQYMTMEMLSLCLYWIHAALQVNLSAGGAEQVFNELQNRIATEWESTFGLQGHDQPSYWEEMKQRRQGYDEIIGSGGTPMSLNLEAAALLESAQVISREDRQKLLALFIDLIPVETFGELAVESSEREA